MLRRLLLVVVLVALLALWPGVARAQMDPGPPLLEAAENVAVCTQGSRTDRVFGDAWVEPRDDGYRVALWIADPPFNPGPVLTWFDLTQVPGDASFTVREDGAGWAYGVLSRDTTSIVRSGDYQDDSLLFYTQRCLRMLVWQPRHLDPRIPLSVRPGSPSGAPSPVTSTPVGN